MSRFRIPFCRINFKLIRNVRRLELTHLPHEYDSSGKAKNDKRKCLPVAPDSVSESSTSRPKSSTLTSV